MDQRTIQQILSNPTWLRQTLAEERPIGQQLPAGGAGPDYQQVALQHPSTFVPPPPSYPNYPVQQTQVPARPESPPVEVRGTIAYIARYRGEYFNPQDPSQMITLMQAVITNQTGTLEGETPPPWFPDVQFWIQTFERIDPYAEAQQAELERLHTLKLEQESRLREAERAEQLRRERALYGEPGTFSRAGTLTGLAVEPTRENGWEPGEIPGSRPDWLGDVLRDITSAIGGIHQRLEAMERRGADGAAGAGAAVHSDPDRPGDPDRDGRDGADAAAARRDPEKRVAVEAYPDVAAEPARDDAVDAAGDPVSEPGGEARAADPGHRADRTRRYAPTKKGT